MSQARQSGRTTLSRHELMAVRDSIDCEEDLQKYLEAGMLTEGWDVIREMNPDNSNKRVDLVGIHPQYGRIGVETKYQNNGSFGSHVAEGIRQILGYSKHRYLGEEIDLWAIGIHGSKFKFIQERIRDDEEKRRRLRELFWKLHTQQRVVNGFGIGWLNLSNDRVVVEFAADTPTYRIPLFTLEERGWPWWYNENGEFDRPTVVQKVNNRWLTNQ